MNSQTKKNDCANCDSRGENIFCKLPQDGLKFLDEHKVINHYKKGQYIFYSGNFPTGLYCVNKGVVKLETEGPQGNAHILRMVSPGGILGYRSLFSEEPYRASAVVHEEATLCLIPKAAILELVKKYPDVSIKLLSQLSKELRQAEERFCGLTDKNATERVAEALLFLKENFEDQTWTRREIAEWAGTTPETVMRTLASFEDEGLIEQKGRKIMLKNRKALMERANLGL